MATGAVRRHLRSATRSEAVIAVKVGGYRFAGYAELLRKADALMAARAGGARDVLRRDGRIGVEVRFDRVDAMAIRTDGSLAVAPGKRLPVNALHELGLDGLVAFPAREGHVEFVDRGFGIACCQYLVSAVAFGADG